MSKLQNAFERISQWMVAHDAPLLAENLAPGATADELADAEEQLGFPIPAGLRELWSLHNGQLEEMNGFIESLDFLDLARAVDERDSVLPAIEFLREDPSSWPEAGVTEVEALSDQWVPFAGRDSDLIAVSGVTGRVFHVMKDAPPLKLAAASVEAWATAFAARVEADDYEVEEGFGDYYLSERDRGAEARAAAAAKQKKEAETYRKKTPLLEQLQAAIERGDADRAQRVLEDQQKRSTAALAEGTQALMAAKVSPTFLAQTLRPLLNAVTLTPDQWLDVAEGGAVIDNLAVRDIALGRSTGRSAARVSALTARVAAEKDERVQRLLKELLSLLSASERR